VGTQWTVYYATLKTVHFPVVGCPIIVCVPSAPQVHQLTAGRELVSSVVWEYRGPELTVLKKRVFGFCDWSSDEMGYFAVGWLVFHGGHLPDNIIINLRQKIQQKIDHTSPPTGPKSNTKWTTFTYASPQIRKITNLFRHTKVKITFKCNNKICQLMKPSTDNNTPYYNRSGIYKQTCNTWKLAYVGQTSRKLKLRFQEHTRYIRYNDPQSAYAQHFLHNRHEYGPIDHTMTILKPLNP